MNGISLRESNPESRTDSSLTMRQLLHELQQPLTALQCVLELGMSGSRSRQEYRNYFRDALVQVRRVADIAVAMRDGAVLNGEEFFK